MSAVNATSSGRQVSCEAQPFRPRRNQGARFATRSIDNSTAVLTAEGEIDAANAEDMGQNALLVAESAAQLVLDFGGVEFFGTEGFSTLHVVNVRCSEAGVRWVMVPSPAVARVLRLCDPEGILAVADTLDAGLAAVRDPSGPALTLVNI